MSITARTEYLESLVAMAERKLQPLLDQYNSIDVLIQELKESWSKELKDLDSKLISANLSSDSLYITSLEEERQQLQQYILDSEEGFFSGIKSSILEFSSKLEEDIDGISISLSESNNKLTANITHKLLNRTTDLIKNTIEDSDTVAIINTNVTGVAGPYTIIGSGSQLAPLKTT